MICNSIGTIHDLSSHLNVTNKHRHIYIGWLRGIYHAGAKYVNRGSTSTAAFWPHFIIRPCRSKPEICLKRSGTNYLESSSNLLTRLLIDLPVMEKFPTLSKVGLRFPP